MTTGGRLGELIGGWRSGRGSLPTTSAGVELCALTVFLGLRVVNVGQLAISLPTALRHTTWPAAFLAVLAAYLVESVLLGVAVVRARAYRSKSWGRVDVAVAVAVLLAQPAIVAPADMTGSWTAWGFACTLGSACGAAIVFARRQDTSLAVLALTCAYLMGSWPTALPSARSTVVANAFSYAGFALLTRLLVGYLRRLGAHAEQARREATAAAAEAARLREVERQRALLHDNISVLSLLARRDLPADLAGPLRSQAATLAGKVRAFVDDHGPAEGITDALPQAEPGDTAQTRVPRGARLLTSVVRSAAEGFWDLPLALNLDLAQGAELAGPAAAAVEAAVATLLHNARLHAEAGAVVVHADIDTAAAAWQLTVRDDGRGFDPQTTELGFGLRVLVTETLTRHHIRVDLHSVPGDGTTATLSGPLEGEP